MAASEQTGTRGAWTKRYTRLLEAAGVCPESFLTQALPSSSEERTGLFSLARCLEDPALLVDQVKADYPSAADARAVRARVSVLQQDLALNIIAPLTLRLFRDGQAPLPDTQHIFLAPDEPGTSVSSRWFQTPGAPVVSEPQFVELVGRQTSGWYPVFRQRLGVSPGAYWSSIGLGLGAPFSAVWNLAEPAAVCDLAQCWLGEFSNEANQFIDWIPAVFGGQTTAIPQRKGCCLKYLLPEGGYCGTCGVYRKERLAALRHQQPSPGPGQWQAGR